ncbi:MAG: TIGR00282 family metallophosphoesterase [Candidatus Limnocylindrales bacterium]
MFEHPRPATDRRTVGDVLAADRLPSPPPRPVAGTVRVLMIGDLIGKPGRLIAERHLPEIRDERAIDFVTANGENLAGGMGLTVSTAHALFECGVDVITSGNHIWDKREIYPELEREERILRPINYGTHEVPGRGWGIFHAAEGTEIAVVNAQGRTFMQPIENPFTDLDRLLEDGADELPQVRLVDFHCELTSEKTAFGVHLDGRVSAVCGTHTHVPTADERILPRGTAYVSDLGMTGPIDSVIGFAPETVLPRFLNGLPTRFEVGSGAVVFNAIQIDIDTRSGAATAIARISRLFDA